MINLEMPEEVEKYVRDFQGKKKGEANIAAYSLQKAIFAIIKEHKQLTEDNLKLRQEIEKLHLLIEELNRD
jgi:hypothetical protein